MVGVVGIRDGVGEFTGLCSRDEQRGIVKCCHGVTVYPCYNLGRPSALSRFLPGATRPLLDVALCGLVPYYGGYGRGGGMCSSSLRPISFFGPCLGGRGPD